MRPSINMRITLLATNDQETKRNCMNPITDQKKLQIYVKLPQVIVLGMCAIILHQNNKKVGIFLYVQTLRFVA